MIGAQAIEWLCVQGCRNTKEPVLTWKRTLPGADLASSTTLALLFTSGEPPRGFTRQGEGEFEQIDTVHVFIRIQPKATAGFTIESAAIVR